MPRRTHEFFPDFVPPVSVPGVADIMPAGPPPRYQRVVLSCKELDLATAIGGGASGNGARFDFAGTVLWAVQASSADAEIEVKFNGEGDFVPFRRGRSIGGVPFDHLLIRSAAQAGETMHLLFATDSPDRPIETEA